MGIFRVLLAALVVWLVYRFFSSNGQKRLSRRPADKASTVRCRFCGVFVPEGEALEINGQYYCCQEHADSDGA